MGGATKAHDRHLLYLRISIHAPRGGSDLRIIGNLRNRDGFQSTLPVGGATDVDINGKELVRISIHAPRGGSDYCPDLV